MKNCLKLMSFIRYFTIDTKNPPTFPHKTFLTFYPDGIAKTGYAFKTNLTLLTKSSLAENKTHVLARLFHRKKKKRKKGDGGIYPNRKTVTPVKRGLMQFSYHFSRTSFSFFIKIDKTLLS